MMSRRRDRSRWAATNSMVFAFFVLYCSLRKLYE